VLCFYEGDWKNNQRDGKGIEIHEYNTGYLNRYEGGFKNDMKEGKGKFSYYQNVCDMPHSIYKIDSMRTIVECIYDGDWKSNKKDGKGIEIYGDVRYDDDDDDEGNVYYIISNSSKMKNSYEGDFKNGMKEGRGKFMYHQNMKVESGIYSFSEFGRKVQCVYEG
jgi:hypothetical protein